MYIFYHIVRVIKQYLKIYKYIISNKIKKEMAIMFHYVYQITNKINGKIYIGSRTSNIEPANDLGKKYFSSSKDKEFQKEQRENPENFIYEVLSIYNNKDDMLNEEIRLHNLYDVGKNPNYYNKSKQTSKNFSTSGRLNVKDKNGNVDEYRKVNSF
jgi:hypothetical protein